MINVNLLPAAAALGRLAVSIASMIGLLVPALCLAQQWPVAPIKYIVPFPPGGSTDVVSRYVAERLRDRLGQPVVIENIGGAGATIGVTRIARAAPDGYTIGLGNSASHTINPHMTRSRTYDPVADFAPISIVNEYLNALLAHPRVGVRTLKELITLAKAKPGVLTYGSSGVGASNHLSGELLARMADVRLVHVPYKGGSGALADLQGGHIDLLFLPVESTVPFIKDGTLRGLGTTGSKRSHLLPDMPTMAETIPGYEVAGFMAVFAPAKTPTAIIDRLNAEIVGVMHSADARDNLGKRGFVPVSSSPGELLERIKADNVRWKAVIEAAGITLE